MLGDPGALSCVATQLARSTPCANVTVNDDSAFLGCADAREYWKWQRVARLLRTLLLFVCSGGGVLHGANVFLCDKKHMSRLFRVP